MQIFIQSSSVLLYLALKFAEQCKYYYSYKYFKDPFSVLFLKITGAIVNIFKQKKNNMFLCFPGEVITVR